MPHTIARTVAVPLLPDLLCFSHLRWDFVFQRPQHLMTRFARERRVFYVEEPVFDAGRGHLEVSRRADGLHVVTPHLPSDLPQEELQQQQANLLHELFAAQAIRSYIHW